MNLTTHVVVAFAIGITVFHNVPVALIITTGALIPDLDREYLFIAKRRIEQYQLHRSLFHNLLWIGFLYIVNPFLALGALSHSLLDSFTSATDRGVELLFPFTRLINGYYYNIKGTEAVNTKKRKWWVEDPWALLKNTSDRDLQEPTKQPWRRSYGPFRNSRIVDWAIFFASLIFLAVLYFGVNGSYSSSGYDGWLIVSFIGIAIFYGLGEIYRRKLIKDKQEAISQMLDPKDKEKESERLEHKTVREMLTSTGLVVLAILIVGIAIFIYAGIIGRLFLFQLPSSSILMLCSYGLGSLFGGFVIAWVWLRVRKNSDLSM